jgi:iron complex outermembrane receptor protein
MSKWIGGSAGCGLAAAIAMILAAPVEAQEAAPVMAAPASGGLEEVIVTARRREEDLQSVPIAISAFTSDELHMLQAEDLSGLQGTVPNMNLVQGRGSATSANIYIRGIGQPDALQTFDPGVGVYLDDVYIARIQGALFNLYDVQRVEVLRGPQGTLYGKNTPAGAIRLVSKTPPQETTGQFEMQGGNYDYFTGKGYLGGHITDTLGASISGIYVTRSGVTEDPATKRDYNDLGTTAGRVILAWDPTDNLDINLAADYTRTHNALNLGYPEAPLIQLNLATIPATPVVLQPAPTKKWDWKVATDFTGNKGQTSDDWGTALTVGWKLSDAWLLKSITAYRSLKPDNYIDIDASIYSLGNAFVGVDQDQTSQEFQLLYSSGQLEGVVGLYYFDEHIKSDQWAEANDFLTFGAIPIDFRRTVNDKLTTDSYAAFAQGTWRFAENWSATVGLRYTDESKDYFRTTSTYSWVPALTGTFEYKDNDSWTAWTPTFAVDYQLTPDSMLYASATEGFKSGGFNGRANTPGETGAYNPEYVWTYEVGSKNTLQGGLLRLNGDVFYSDYTDFQARVSEVVNPNDPIPTFSFPVVNAGAMDIYGAELEALWVPIEALNLQAQVGYLRADYRKFTATVAGPDGQPVIQDRSKDHPPFAPAWTVRLAAAYTFGLGDDGSLTLSTDMLYRAKQWLSVDNRDVLTQDGYSVYNALASWESAGNSWYGYAGVKNIGNKAYKVDAQEFSSVGNIQTAYYGDPRTYQVTMGYRF